MSNEHDATVHLARSKVEEASKLRASGRWLEARDNCAYVLECSHKLYNASPRSLVAMSEQLLVAGRLLNSLMDFARGGACLDTSLNLVLSNGALQIPGALACLCETFACLTHTYLHKQQLEAAIEVATICRRALLSHMHQPLVQHTVGLTLLEIGLAHIDRALTAGAVDLLERARAHLHMIDRPPIHVRTALAKVHSALGYCYMCAGDIRAQTCLLTAVRMCRVLGWPLVDCGCVLGALKYSAEVRLRRDGVSPPQGKVAISEGLTASVAAASALAPCKLQLTNSCNAGKVNACDVRPVLSSDLSPADSDVSAATDELWRVASIDLDSANVTLTAAQEIPAEDDVTADEQTCSDLLAIHATYSRHNLSAQVPDTLSYLGSVALQRQRPHSALVYYNHALILGRQQSQTPEQMRRLLRFVAMSSYNCELYDVAVVCYRECLSSLEADDVEDVDEQIAECCASLGFTYARLRHFDNMLFFYERALQAPGRLPADDRELIETNIGGLHHVQAARIEAAGDSDGASHCYARAEHAFVNALRYSHRSFPFISYGYYLLWRGRYEAAASILNTAYENGVLDGDTVEFDRAELPVLLADLRAELSDCDDLRVPATIVALYLRTLAEANQPDMRAATATLAQLTHEARACRYENYFVEDYGVTRMCALSHSLLGYAHVAAGNHTDALTAFQTAAQMMPGYSVALRNVALQKSRLLCYQATAQI